MLLLIHKKAEISIVSGAKQELCHLMVYLFLNYFGVVWMGEVLISMKSCKSYKSTVKSLKWVPCLNIVQS